LRRARRPARRRARGFRPLHRLRILTESCDPPGRPETDWRARPDGPSIHRRRASGLRWADQPLDRRGRSEASPPSDSPETWTTGGTCPRTTAGHLHGAHPSAAARLHRIAQAERNGRRRTLVRCDWNGGRRMVEAGMAGKATEKPAKGTAKRGPRRASVKPRLLAGGNPQIAIGDGDAPVQAHIRAMPG